MKRLKQTGVVFALLAAQQAGVLSAAAQKPAAYNSLQQIKALRKGCALQDSALQAVPVRFAATQNGLVKLQREGRTDSVTVTSQEEFLDNKIVPGVVRRDIRLVTASGDTAQLSLISAFSNNVYGATYFYLPGQKGAGLFSSQSAYRTTNFAEYNGEIFPVAQMLKNQDYMGLARHICHEAKKHVTLTDPVFDMPNATPQNQPRY